MTSKHACMSAIRSATLEAEPDNKYDSNAIKVKVNGAHVGYIPARMATRLHASSVTPHVCSIAGGPKPHVWLVLA